MLESDAGSLVDEWKIVRGRTPQNYHRNGDVLMFGTTTFLE